MGQRAHHVNTVNIRTWEILFLANIYLNEVLDQIYNSVTQKLPEHLSNLGLFFEAKFTNVQHDIAIIVRSQKVHM